MADTPVQPIFLGNGLEPAASVSGCFNAAQQQHAAIPEREMKHRNNLRLCLGQEVDQQITAGNQIQMRKGWIGKQVLHGEYHECP